MVFLCCPNLTCSNACSVCAAGIWPALRLMRLAVRRGIWRLRNRLLAAYLFMAVVPILLIATLAVFAVRAIASQVAVYLVTSELDRRIEGLRLLGESLAASTRFSKSLSPAWPCCCANPSRETRYPPDAVLPAPTAGWGIVQGVIRREDQLFSCGPTSRLPPGMSPAPHR